MRHSQQNSSIKQLVGYLAIPHELLHVAGYRLAGQRCRYQWGELYVVPVGPMKLGARLMGILFPFAVFSLLFLMCAGLSGLAYAQSLRSSIYDGFTFWLIMGHITGLYACTAIGDLRQAYLLIVNKPWYSWTPFDIFYWPFVDWSEVRKRVLQEKHDQES